MSAFKLAIRSAPQRRGKIGDVDLDGGPGPSWTGPTPVFQGNYVGEINRTFRFTVDVGGTLLVTPVITVSWTEFGPDANTGVLNIGVDVYALGDVIHVFEGLMVEFLATPSLVCTATQTFEVDVVANREVPLGSYREVITNMEKTSVDLIGMELEDRDLRLKTWDQRTLRAERALLRNPSLRLDWLERHEWRDLQDLEQFRQRVTVFENYDASTRLLWRAGHGSIVGPAPVYHRGGLTAVTYRDPDSGLFKLTAAGLSGLGSNYNPRITSGPETESFPAAEAADERHRIPTRYHAVGRSITLSDGRTNMVEKFHPAKDDDGTLDLGWEGYNGGVVSFVDDVPGVLDPDGGFVRKFTRGVVLGELKDFASSGGIRTATADRFAVTAGEFYTPCFWIRGRGRIRLQMTTGAGTVGNNLIQWDVNLDENPPGAGYPDTVSRDGHVWKRYWRKAPVVPGGHNLADLRIRPASLLGPDTALVYVSAVQVLRSLNGDDGTYVDDIIPTDGSSALASADTFQLSEPLPPTGSLSFWFRWPVDDHDQWIGICKDPLEHFVLERSGLAEAWRWWTINTGRAQASLISLNPANIPWFTWVHVAMTWNWEGNLGVPRFTDLRKRFFVNGAKVLDEYAVVASHTDVPFGKLQFFPPGDTGPAADWANPYNAHLAEVRVDDQVWTEAEVLAQYNRVALNEHSEFNRAFGGRLFDIRAESSRWLSPSADSRGKILADVSLEEVDAIDDGLNTRR
jgi:hypothetical protein